jgi:hypothetical protein
MSTELTHGFLAEVQIDARVPQQIFAANFLRRVGLLRLTISQGRDLSIWFDRPELTLIKDPNPAAARVEIVLRMIARLSDRFDEARIFVTARGRITDRTLLHDTETRTCPSLNFADSADSDFILTFSTNPEYDAVVLPAVRSMLRQRSPFALGPLASAAGTRHYRTYFDIANRPEGLLAMFIAALGEPPTPATIPPRVFPPTDVVLLVPDDLVDPALQQGLATAGLDSMPAQLNPDVKVRSLQVTLQNGHVLIAGSGTKTSDVLGIPINTDFTFKAFVQLLVEADGSIGIHVISTQQDLDDTFGEFADFITAGALTRLMEEMVPAAIAGLSLGSFQGLDFFSSSVPQADESAPAHVGSVLNVFVNGLGITYDVDLSTPPQLEPPYFRGHQQSREFHVKGCEFGDRIAVRNLRLFPTRESAIQAGYDGCATCQPDFSIASFGDLVAIVVHPPDTEPDVPVSLRVTYAGDLVRFGVTLAPEPEEDVSEQPFDADGVPTHHVAFAHIVPTRWTVSMSCGTWSVETTVQVANRFIAADGQLQGNRTELRATVGQPGVELIGG